MNANKAGKIAENIVADIMRGVGLQFLRQVRVGESIYSRPGRPHVLRADFVVTNLIAFPSGVAVESKWQDSSGSVDEKFPYLADNIQKCYQVPAVVIVHGGHCRLGALEYLRARCDGQHLIAVYRLEEFISWALRSEKHERMPSLFPEEVEA